MAKEVKNTAPGGSKIGEKMVMQGRVRAKKTGIEAATAANTPPNMNNWFG